MDHYGTFRLSFVQRFVLFQTGGSTGSPISKESMSQGLPSLSSLQCSGDCCGEQRQGRRVECRAINGGGFLVHLPDKACSAPKPNTSRTCRRTDCPSWSTSEWGTCTRECQQSREVQCAYNGIVMDSEQCCNQQPLEQRHCPFPCGEFSEMIKRKRR